ncbi:MerR family transcriptional regulator [Tessaracoccus sp. MC1865]|uniref:MerR family transcriptional regulator n=1 Tax=Tessaracoccus sp. MC1865 TaxID=2760310 RepID=UPI0015FF9D1F|nr:MerR family transcriptional regulator [Tessaracoccus sp. MC1865]MBB1482638.1 MerR family transcriptional regulator [Tessaracoccus sp. MC1865]QTO37911.1 MerR family transcriptional regulator [Tessaracoccus sp. MC1865]
MATLSSIGAVARTVGVSVEAVRYYEAEGLIAPPRDDSGRRRYREVDVDALRVITALRKAGFGIREIGDLMAVKRGEDSPVQRIDAGLAALAQLARHLDERQAALDDARSLCQQWEGDLRTARQQLAP